MGRLRAPRARAACASTEVAAEDDVRGEYRGPARRGAARTGANPAAAPCAPLPAVGDAGTRPGGSPLGLPDPFHVVGRHLGNGPER